MGLKDGMPSPKDWRDTVPGHSPDVRALAIGIGFRKACTSESLVAIVREAWRRAIETDPAMAGAPATLVTIAEKDRPVLHQAGAELGLTVLMLPKQALAGTDDRITIASPAAKACLGIPSVAEAAALAAAGAGSRLLVARMTLPDATCAIAVAGSRAAA